MKTTEGVIAAAEVAELRRRNAELESENAELRAQLRRGGRQEGDHEVLPVVTEVIVITICLA